MVNFFIFVFIIAFSFTSSNGQTQNKSVTNNDTTQIESIQVFALGPVGFAGTTSEGEKLAREILSRPDADKTFQKILQEGSAAAKMYALWGLRKIHGRESAKFFDPFRNSSTEVETMSGCLVAKETVADVVNQIENPHYMEFTAKTLWTMDADKRRDMLTYEEEKFLTNIFRIHKANDTLDEIADVPFGKLIERGYKK